MKRMLIIICAAVFTLVSVQDISAQLVWKETGKQMPEKVVDTRNAEGVEVSSSQGAIVIRTDKKVEVRVFTILGQLVSQAVLNPGTSELKMRSRGIYIVKIGNSTQKIAI